MTALSSPDPGRPIDWAMPIRSQAARNAPAVYSLPWSSALSRTLLNADEGLDFLGWRIQCHSKKGAGRYYVYTYPAKKALRAIMTKVKTLCRQVGSNEPLDTLLRRLNPALQGWCAYFRPGCSARTFAYLSHYVRHRGVAMAGCGLKTPECFNDACGEPGALIRCPPGSGSGPGKRSSRQGRHRAPDRLHCHLPCSGDQGCCQS
jgi:hypothetical protein